MSLCRFACKSFKACSLDSQDKLSLRSLRVCLARNSSSSTYHEESEYTDVPKYPEILDLRSEATYIRERDKKLDKIKILGTIEEKLIGINMPRFYGWSSLMLHEGNYPFNFLPFVQHITRTDLIEVKNFPFINSLTKSELSTVVDRIRPQLQDAILVEVAKKRRRHIVDGSAEAMSDGELNDDVTVGVVEHINRILSTNLAKHAPHIYETEVDFEPRIEAFWRVGGFYPSQETYDQRKKDKKDHEKDRKWFGQPPRDICSKKEKVLEEPDQLDGHFIQYLGTPVLQLRHSNPLKPLEQQVSHVSDEANENQISSSVGSREPDLSQVPDVRYDPGFYGLEKIRRHGTNIPGFWPGDPNEFGLLSFHKRGHMLGRPPSFGDEDEVNTIASQAILAGYAWLLGQANYQGFSTFHDITYPLSTSTIVTDGRVFSFFAYQLNTLLMHDEFIDTNPKVNACYSLPMMELYKDIKGDEIIGWNDKVLSLLVDAYMNAPAKREGLDLKPYVDKAVPLVQNIEHEERRVWLHKNFRHFFSNRPRGRPDPEIWDWEMIYKVKFQTRPMDARRRFFELGIDPFKRRLDDRANIYIPRPCRDPDNPKKKMQDSFWPDC